MQNFVITQKGWLWDVIAQKLNKNRDLVSA